LLDDGVCMLLRSDTDGTNPWRSLLQFSFDLLDERFSVAHHHHVLEVRADRDEDRIRRGVNRAHMVDGNDLAVTCEDVLDRGYQFRIGALADEQILRFPCQKDRDAGEDEADCD
jgi:hypothetical protein